MYIMYINALNYIIYVRISRDSDKNKQLRYKDCRTLTAGVA